MKGHWMGIVDARIANRLEGEVARLEGELAEVKGELIATLLNMAQVVGERDTAQAAIRAKDAALRVADVYFTLQNPEATSFDKTKAMEGIGDFEGGWVDSELQLLGLYRGRARRAVSAALSPDAGKGCICDGPPPQPCSPTCKYPYTDQRGGPYYAGEGWLPPEVREALELAKRKSPEAIEILRKHGYVFEHVPPVTATGEHRWESLAFSLYTDLAEISNRAEVALDALKGVK